MQPGVDPDGEMERMRQENGRSVLRRERYRVQEDTIIAAPADDLRILADRVRSIADAGAGRTCIDSTDESSPQTECYVSFEVISEDELRRRAKGTLKARVSWKVQAILCTTIGGLSLLGAYTLIRFLVGLAK